MEDLSARAWLSMVQELYVDVQFWASFIDRYIRGTSPTVRELVLIQLHWLEILTSLPKFVSLLKEDVRDDALAYRA